jgi:hypothetical protein
VTGRDTAEEQTDMEGIEVPRATEQTTGGFMEACEWVSPGVSVRKRWLTGACVALAAVIFFVIALTQGASMLVSTLIGVVFIGCFVWYLRIVAPEPFTIRLDDQGVTRVDKAKGGEAVTIAWDAIAKVKEEQFKNGTSVSLTVYKRVGERGLHRAWVVYRDDLPRFDELAATLRAALPEGSPWIRETVHD